MIDDGIMKEMSATISEDEMMARISKFEFEMSLYNQRKYVYFIAFIAMIFGFYGSGAFFSLMTGIIFFVVCITFADYLLIQRIYKRRKLWHQKRWLLNELKQFLDKLSFDEYWRLKKRIVNAD